MEGWGRLSHLFVTVFMAFVPVYLVTPAATDVAVEAVCGGEEECSLAIYLTGFQLAVTGLGSVIMMPIIGNLSDAFGRKKILAIPLTLQIIPLLILAWKRTTTFFYAYYSIKILTDMIVDGGVLCISFSYLADIVGEGKRVAAFAVLSGVICIANVCATFATAFLSLPHIFQVPFASAGLGMFFTLSSSSGIAQGCLLAITSLSSIVSPLIFSPLSALFLSDDAPFDFPGFCMLCVGFSYLIGLILSPVIKIKQFKSRDSRNQTLC